MHVYFNVLGTHSILHNWITCVILLTSELALVQTQKHVLMYQQDVGKSISLKWRLIKMKYKLTPLLNLIQCERLLCNSLLKMMAASFFVNERLLGKPLLSSGKSVDYNSRENEWLFKSSI